MASDPRLRADEEPPPFLGSWPRVYIAVVCYLATLILLFYGFAALFTPAVAG